MDEQALASKQIAADTDGADGHRGLESVTKQERHGADAGGRHEVLAGEESQPGNADRVDDRAGDHRAQRQDSERFPAVETVRRDRALSGGIRICTTLSR